MSLVGPAKVKACMSFLFIKGPVKLKIRSFVKLSGLVKTVTKMVTGCLRTIYIQCQWSYMKAFMCFDSKMAKADPFAVYHFWGLSKGAQTPTFK